MRELCKMTEEEKKIFNLPISFSDSYYCFKENEELLGFAQISYSEKTDIYIFILEDKRGNGYGNELFSQVLQNIKDHGIHFLEIEFSLSNMVMARIASRNGGVEITRKEGVVKYYLPIR